jgi:hypothetical protein
VAVPLIINSFMGIDVLFFIHLLCCDQIIANNSDEQQRSFGRHFDIEDELVSHISRRSIDVLKQNYRASPQFTFLLVHVQCDR